MPGIARIYDTIKTNKSNRKYMSKKKCYTGGGMYCVGFLGAVVYYISTATSFGDGVVGFLKAIVWPAFLVFEAMKFLGM